MLRDKDIREPLFDFFDENYGKNRIFEEKMMGRSRADIVMVLPDAIVGIEIKSDADTYVRLSRQVKDYDRYFDYNIVVVGTSHALHIKEHVPDHWGIITVEQVEERFDFYELRKPSKNPNVTWETKLQIMWRPELVKFQAMNEMPKYANLGKAKVIEKIADRIPEKIPEEKAAKQISELLFERDYSTIGETIDAYRKANAKTKKRRVMTGKRAVKTGVRRKRRIVSRVR